MTVAGRALLAAPCLATPAPRVRSRANDSSKFYTPPGLPPPLSTSSIASRIKETGIAP
jgi:hypothetical protein